MKFVLPFIASAVVLAGIVKVLVDSNPVDVPASVLKRGSAATTPVATAAK